MQPVRVKSVSKRLERPSVLTAEEFHKLLPHIREPYRTMVLIGSGQGTGTKSWRQYTRARLSTISRREEGPTDLNRCEPAVLLWACSVRVPARLSECGRSWRSRTRSPHSAAPAAV